LENDIFVVLQTNSFNLKLFFMTDIFYSKNALSKEYLDNLRNNSVLNLPENCAYLYFHLNVEDEQENFIRDIIEKNCFNVHFFKNLTEVNNAIKNDKYVNENRNLRIENAGEWVDFELKIIEISDMRFECKCVLKGKMMSSYCLEVFPKITYYDRK